MKPGQNKYLTEDVHQYDVNTNTREIFLHSHVDEPEDIGVDFRNSNKFLKNIRLLESINNNPIYIHQHNIGGDWYEGMLIYDAVKSSPCKVICIMHGQACSMGSLIPQAADLRIIMPNALFMTHRGSVAIGNLTVKQADSFSDIEKYYRAVMLDIYADRCLTGEYFSSRNYNKFKVEKFLAHKWDKYEDWYLTPKDSVLYGFADEVLGTKHKYISEL